MDGEVFLRTILTSSMICDKYFYSCHETDRSSVQLNVLINYQADSHANYQAQDIHE
jgi:hypothetical protein